MDERKKPEHKWPNYIVVSPYAPTPHPHIDAARAAPTAPRAAEPPPAEPHRTRLERLEAAAALAACGLGGIAVIATTPVPAVVAPARPDQPLQPRFKPPDESLRQPAYTRWGNAPTMYDYHWQASPSQFPLFIAQVPEYPSFSLDLPSTPADPADELMRVLALAFPEDNTPEKQAESRQALRDGMEEMKKGAGEIGKDWAKDIAKDHMTEVALLIGGTLFTIGKKRNIKMLQWAGATIQHIVHPFAKEEDPSSVGQNADEEEHPQLTASAAADAAGCTVEQAEAVMKYLGYRKVEVWLPPGPVR